MIQFHRYTSPDESPDFHTSFLNFVETFKSELDGDCTRSIGLLEGLAKKFPQNERLPAVAARLYFWGKADWSSIERIMPPELPIQVTYKQELVCCLGLELSNAKWNLTERDFYRYQGLSGRPRLENFKKYGRVLYRPRGSGFFSVIENIIAASVIAELEGKSLIVDLQGNWWTYEEPFEKLFEGAFEFVNVSEAPYIEFDYFRNKWSYANDSMIDVLSEMKKNSYKKIYECISRFVGNDGKRPGTGIIFVRGGDKLYSETILPPMNALRQDLLWMKRRCNERHVLSDDKDLGSLVASLDHGVIDRSDDNKGGYHYNPRSKSSCKNILKNYLDMVGAKENFSCPSANIVNAAMWTRTDKDNYSMSNPVYRYLLL